MYICPNCKNSFEAPINFCPLCGTKMEVETQPVKEETPSFQPTVAPEAQPAPEPVLCRYSEPMVEAPWQPVKRPSKAKAIVGMVLSIVGICYAVFGLLYTAMFLNFSGISAFIFGFIFFLFGFPAALVGLIMSAKSRSAGDITVFSRLGKIFGIIGVVISAIMFVLALSGVASDDDYPDLGNPYYRYEYDDYDDDYGYDYDDDDYDDYGIFF